MASGIPVRAMGCVSADRSDDDSVTSGVHWLLKFVVTTSDSSISWVNHESNTFEICRCFGYMTQAGAAADTAVVNRITALGTTAAISDTADLSVFANKEQFDFSEIDDDTNVIVPGDTVNITTASSPACVIYVEGYWKE